MTYFGSQLKSIASTYGVLTMITEYNWPYILNGDQDGSGYVEVTGSDGNYTDGSYGYWKKWSVSRQGQADMITEVNTYFADAENENTLGITPVGDVDMIGSYYWEPSWIAAGNQTGWSTTAVSRWYQYGCGVATYQGASYLGWSGYSNDEYNKASGSATDENTLFNANGSAAASLAALNYSTDVMPIKEAMAQVSQSETATGYHSVRFVGEIALESASAYDATGFKVEYCNSTGSQIKTIAFKSTTALYSGIKADGDTITPDDGSYYYAYKFDKIPSSGTYYFKVIAVAKGTANYQQAIKYYKYTNGSLSTIDPWSYPGTNASLTSDTYSTLYPSYMK